MIRILVLDYCSMRTLRNNFPLFVGRKEWTKLKCILISNFIFFSCNTCHISRVCPCIYGGCQKARHDKWWLRVHCKYDFWHTPGRRRGLLVEWDQWYSRQSRGRESLALGTYTCSQAVQLHQIRKVPGARDWEIKGLPMGTIQRDAEQSKSALEGRHVLLQRYPSSPQPG